MKLYELFPKKLVDVCYHSVFHKKYDQGKHEALSLGFTDNEFWQVVTLIRYPRYARYTGVDET